MANIELSDKQRGHTHKHVKHINILNYKVALWGFRTTESSKTSFIRNKAIIEMLKVCVTAVGSV